MSRSRRTAVPEPVNVNLSRVTNYTDLFFLLTYLNCWWRWKQLKVDIELAKVIKGICIWGRQLEVVATDSLWCFRKILPCINCFWLQLKNVFLFSPNYGVIMMIHIVCLSFTLYSVKKNNMCTVDVILGKLEKKEDEKQFSTVCNPESNTFRAEAAICEFKMRGRDNGIYCSLPRGVHNKSACSCLSNIKFSASVPIQLEVGFVKTGRFHRLQLPLSPWTPVSGEIEEQSQWWKLWGYSDSMCCKSGKQASQLSSHNRGHGWKSHHKALLTWILDSYLHSDPGMNFLVSVANRHPPENGKMFEILLLYFLCALWEELIFSSLCVETAQT